MCGKANSLFNTIYFDDPRVCVYHFKNSAFDWFLVTDIMSISDGTASQLGNGLVPYGNKP